MLLWYCMLTQHHHLVQGCYTISSLAIQILHDRKLPLHIICSLPRFQLIPSTALRGVVQRGVPGSSCDEHLALLARHHRTEARKGAGALRGILR